VHTYIRTYVHTYIRTYGHTYIRTYIQAYIRTYVHTYIHTYIKTYIHISIGSGVANWMALSQCTKLQKNRSQQTGRGYTKDVGHTVIDRTACVIPEGLGPEDSAKNASNLNSSSFGIKAHPMHCKKDDFPRGQ